MRLNAKTGVFGEERMIEAHEKQRVLEVSCPSVLMATLTY